MKMILVVLLVRIIISMTEKNIANKKIKAGTK